MGVMRLDSSAGNTQARGCGGASPPPCIVEGVTTRPRPPTKTSQDVLPDMDQASYAVCAPRGLGVAPWGGTTPHAIA